MPKVKAPKMSKSTERRKAVQKKSKTPSEKELLAEITKIFKEEKGFVFGVGPSGTMITAKRKTDLATMVLAVAHFLQDMDIPVEVVSLAARAVAEHKNHHDC